MFWIKICYDCANFRIARTAIVGITEKEGVITLSDYFKDAKEKLFKHLSEKHGIEKNEVIIYNHEYLGRIDIIS